MDIITKIRFAKDLSIGLTADGTWLPSDADMEPLAGIATILSKSYEYSPSHGPYGPLLARQVADKIGGRVELLPPKTATTDEGIVF